MKISYNWLCDYLPSAKGFPIELTPEKLSTILTGIGLEVENLEKVEAVRGGLEGLIIGEVMEVSPHPNADKLKLTRVNIGKPETLSIVCGANNVATGQKVVVAPVGCTIYPVTGETVIIKNAKIRGEESQGMLCAEDEIGLGSSHSGIMVLQNGAVPGIAAADYFRLQDDWVFEIGLTPNRMDAMSHLGVARDICAYSNHHYDTQLQVRIPDVNDFKVDSHELPIEVKIENQLACPRYAGVSLSHVRLAQSPEWIQRRLKAIGLRPINNVVDITNFVLHECGQPLHAFDADAISGQSVIVKNLPQDTLFVTLDEKERKLDAEDLIICNAKEGMCIAGVFGGLYSGVKTGTTRIFLESACFQPASIRRTSLRQGLRTDAATRFEKGTDISNVLFALQRAALLMKELAGARIASNIVDVYPAPKQKTKISFSYAYLKKLSGKDYDSTAVKRILENLGFSISKTDREGLILEVPFSKPDISVPADVVEEIMRIDGLDNVQIPSTITITPSSTGKPEKKLAEEKIATYLAGNGFREICTNSITNSKYFTAYPQGQLVKMLNNLSAELDVMRPSMLETGLESIAYNLNRKNEDLFLFEFGKVYSLHHDQYKESRQLCLYLTGNKHPASWMHPPQAVDIYFLKGILQNILRLVGINDYLITEDDSVQLEMGMQITFHQQPLMSFGSVKQSLLEAFDVRQPLWYAQIKWEDVLELIANNDISYQEIPRYPSVRRDLALILDKKVGFAEVEKTAKAAKIKSLQQIQLFDVFESEKIGSQKKSYAISFLFQDMDKTLTDKEIDASMQRLMKFFTNNLKAEIRK
jgi:phenylalanyl-tRNA synthetase beta chain